MILGLVSLVGNALGASTAEAKRKIRVILWGTLVGVVPIMLCLGAQELFGFHLPLWLAAVLVILLYLFPLSFAYAVVKHRVMEIPVLLRRSARYIFVQRGFVVFMVLAGTAAALLFVLAGLRLARLYEAEEPFMVPVIVLAAVSFGSLLALAGEQIHHRVSQRIDRAFFRSAYDARQILQGLAEATRTVAGRRELAMLLESQIEEALHPASVVAYVDSPAGGLAAVSGRTEVEPRTIPAGWPLLAEIATKAKPWDATPARAPDLSWLAPLRPECLVPMAGREGKLEGLLVLGPRLSEEPYAREDKRLLETVASQAAVALESLRLAEQMAERLENERRTAYEMSIALQVQAKLFPQRRPPLRTLDYVGGCVQAREIGGDYYDFLDMGPGRVGLVLADISGKGISAALLMANLQANLRSQYALALHDLPRFLASVNRLFHESTSPQHYATMFFGDYDDSTRRLRYANCGHNPPVLLRAGGHLELLEATATVLGLFENWKTSVREAEVRPGDTLLIFSDGAPDARSDNDEVFGDERVVETLRKCAHLSAGEILESFIREIQIFSGREREDDLTLVVARGL
jgi:sigma-B regulation protein RsbU (phosphoserine phosphatase)